MKENSVCKETGVFLGKVAINLPYYSLQFYFIILKSLMLSDFKLAHSEETCFVIVFSSIIARIPESATAAFAMISDMHGIVV